ncbi:Ubiquitin-conjugating enzyme E2 J1 [Cladobotryum mycophilum]|uniref:Ubiquitin-conjugating enzyme E2 J1 n=1 Tax=Cladobotryum mycophilum TaxID=491253 RepID=A0ABR0SM71_9HYPO
MTPQISSKSPTIRRILREAAELSNTPSPDYAAEPLESDLFEWHFTLRGPPNSVYGEGIYHGRIVLPPAYPLRPPSFRFNTPNGRFEANREICLSISGHHEETWQPAWGIRTALVALRSFMETDARGQLGGLETTEAVRRRLAKESGSYRCSVCAKTNADIIEESENRCKDESFTEEKVEIPQELSMGWRDEMEAAKPQSSSAVPSKNRLATAGEDEASEAELAEGFVQTAPYIAGSTSTAVSHRTHSQPGQNTQDPTNRLRYGQTDTVRPMERRGGDAVPAWIDRAIVALVVILIALLLKVFFGL